jgi:acetyl esterase/lipase
MRPHLVRLGKPQEAGSIRLFPPKTSCSIVERTVLGIWLYDYTPLGFTVEEYNKPNHILLYFAGGGFQSPPSREHWRFCASLCSALGQRYAISIVSYPLAPASPASKSLPALRKLLVKVFESAQEEKGSVTLMGDSAGANVALSLAFWHARRFEEGVHPGILKNVLVISPPTDLRNQNPAISESDRHDPILSKDLVESVAVAWAGELPRDSPELSPLLDDISAVKQAEIKIHGVIGTFDVLAPDAMKFREICEKEGVMGDWMIWEGQMHCFPLAACYGLKEGKVARDWVVDVLRRNA